MRIDNLLNSETKLAQRNDTEFCVDYFGLDQMQSVCRTVNVMPHVI